MPRERRRRGRRPRYAERKDRLIQTRVDEDLERALKKEAARRRLTVSHLIRNTLQDTFHLVENVTSDVEQIVTDSVELAAAVGRDAKRIASIVRGRREGDDKPAALEIAPADPSDLSHVYGWNRVIANRALECVKCRAAIPRGNEALFGLSDDPSKPRVWLCPACAATL